MQPSISLTTTIAPLEWWVADDYKLVDFPDALKPRRTLIVRRGFHGLRRYTICADARTRVELVVRSRGEPKTLAPRDVVAAGCVRGPVAGDMSAMAARARAEAARREALARQLASEHSIFLDLANAVASSRRRNSPQAFEAARAFTKKWGMLSVTSADRSLSSTVESFLGNARLMRKALTDAERNDWHLPLDKIRFLRGVTLGHGLTLQPKDLFQYCRLELLAAFESRFRFYRCGGCGKYGLLREPGRSGPDRQYCSDACRKKAERARAARARAA
jgi:hypothetical protein